MQATATPEKSTGINLHESLIGMEQLEEILETAICSGYLINVIPLSMMLIGPSGAAKSKVIMQYQSGLGCHITTDITSSGMQELLAKDSKEEIIKFVIIPDFNIVLSHRHATLQLTVANLLSMTSEGSIRIDDGRAVKEVKHSPVGIISAMTPAMYSAIGKKWVALGFSRRFLPINYDYSLKTRERIQNSIAAGLTTMLQLAEKRIDRPQRTDIIINDEQSARIMNFSHDLAANIGWVPVPNRKDITKPKAINTGKQIEFSPHIILRTLARAHALRDNRLEVDDSDIEFCMKLIGFTRFDQPVQL